MPVERGDERDPPDWRPRPDPTVLTTEALRREIGGLRELLTAEIRTLDEKTRARMDAMDAATLLRLDTMGHFPDRINEEIGHLKDIHEHDVAQLQDAIAAAVHVHDEKFKTVDLRFIERDVRTQQAAETSQKALDAALLAAAALVSQQNEANAAAAAKAELSFGKQVDQIGLRIETLEKGIQSRLEELKERVDRGEGAGAGGSAQRLESRSVVNLAIAAMGVILVIISIAFAIYAAKK